MDKKEKIRLAVELIKNGKTSKQASELIGITEWSLNTLLSRSGIKISDLRGRINAKEKTNKDGKYLGKITPQMARTEIARHRGYIGAAKHFGVEHQSFKAWCRKNGLTVGSILGGDSHARKQHANIKVKNQYTPSGPSIFYEQATVKDIFIRNKLDGGLSLCA